MIAWIIILLVLLLILAFPVGIDAAFASGAFSLKIKLGPFRKAMLPRTKPTRKKQKKKKEEPAEKPPDETKKKKQSLTLDDILTLAEIGLDALHKFRIHLSVDRFRLHWVAAAADPCDAVMQYGRINAALGALLSRAHSALKIRDEDVRTELDLEAEHPEISAQIILSIQIWELLLIAGTAGFAGLRWLIRRKRSAKAAAAAETERSKEDGEL